MWATIAAASVPGLACETSEAAPALPEPVRRDAGVVDASVVDAAPIDAGVLDAPMIDAAAVDAPTDAGELDARNILRDASEAPPLHDASILGDR